MKTWIIQFKSVLVMIVCVVEGVATAQGLPPKIQICTKAAQIAGDIARYKIQAKNYGDVYAVIETSGLPLAQTTRLKGLLETIWSSVHDAEEASVKLNPAQIQNDYYLTCSK